MEKQSIFSGFLRLLRPTILIRPLRPVLSSIKPRYSLIRNMCPFRYLDILRFSPRLKIETKTTPFSKFPLDVRWLTGLTVFSNEVNSQRILASADARGKTTLLNYGAFLGVFITNWNFRINRFWIFTAETSEGKAAYVSNGVLTDRIRRFDSVSSKLIWRG